MNPDPHNRAILINIMQKLKLIIHIQQIIKNAKSLLWLAWEMDKKVTLLYYFTAAIGGFIPLASAYALKLLVDYLQITQKSFSTTIPVILVVLLAARYLVIFLNSIVYWGINQSYLDYVFRYKLQNEITWKYQHKVSKLDIAHFENSKVQDLMAKTRDTMMWQLPDFLRVLSYLINNIIAFIIAFVVLLPFGYWIPILISIVTIPRLYFQAKYGGMKWSIWGSGAPQVRKLWYMNYLLQQPMVVRETRINQSSEQLLKKFRETQLYLYNLNKGVLDKYLRVISIPPLIEALVIFFVAYQFLPLILSGILTIGSFTLLINMLEQLGGCSANASAHLAQLYEDGLYVNNYFEFLALKPLLQIAKKPVIFQEIKPPKIEFRNVSFSYPDGGKVLDGVSFIIEAGESVAIVGHNGAGKTTIVKLLCRFYEATSGEILINGVNIKELELTQWYKFLGTIFQEFVTYHFMVKENIFLGAPDRKDDEAMKEAAIKSGAAEFIERFSQKYDQVLGKEFENGEELSGGQWQKLAIARAFYGDKPILILDEPTSAIDAEAEDEIVRNLEKECKNKTLVLISHRFSTVRNAKNIIVIDHGKIIEKGSHQELIKLKGQYAKMFMTQAKSYQ